MMALLAQQQVWVCFFFKSSELFFRAATSDQRSCLEIGWGLALGRALCGASA